jgi:cation/acetate symporter
MVCGLGLTLYYVTRTHPFFGGDMSAAWLGINPVSAGAFGVPLGFAVTVLVSLLTPPPSREAMRLVDYVRSPDDSAVAAPREEA